MNKKNTFEKKLEHILLRFDTYTYKDGIFFDIHHPEATDKKNEIRARDAEAHVYDERLSERKYREIESTLQRLGSLEGMYVIEYGCGTGRFTTELLNRGATVLAVDFSPESLKVLRNKVSDTDSLALVCADASHIQTQKDFFDAALAAQFFEHLPTIKDRENFLSHVASTLKRGGVCVATVYHHDIRRRFRAQEKEGQHKNGIYFFFYTKKDILSLWKVDFKITDFRYIDIVLPLMKRLRISEKIQGKISSILEKVPGLSLFGHLICISAIPKK